MDLLSGLGIRAERRMTPRIGVALAGAGAVIAIAGALGIGGDNLTGEDGDLNRIPGVLVSIALIAAGLAVLRRIRSGPLATGASVAVAVGVPALLVFATVKDTYPGFAFDVAVLVATVAWVAAYLVGPARGRLVFLTLALVGAVLFVLEQAEDISIVPREAGNAFASSLFGGYPEDVEGFDETVRVEPPPEPELPDPTTVGGILLAFGVVYGAAGHLVSRRGFDGAGTPFAPLSVVATGLGIAFLSNDLGPVPSGLLLVAFGLAFTFVGAMAARRFTSWSGAAMLGLGVVILTTEALGDTDGTPAFVVVLLVGLAVVLAAHLLVEGIGEGAEEDQRRSLRRDAPRAGHEPGPRPEEIWAPPTSS